MLQENSNFGFIENSSFTEWVKSKQDVIFGFQVYKRLFTPYEQQSAFIDESEYTDVHFELCKVVETVPLGNGDWWVGLRIVYDDEDDDGDGRIEYYRLSEIRLFTASNMQNEDKRVSVGDRYLNVSNNELSFYDGNKWSNESEI